MEVKHLEDYHLRQYEVPYRSTVMFHNFLRERVALDEQRILDMGCGAGANLHYFGCLHPNQNLLA